MKKFLAGLLLGIMVVSAVGCGKSEGELSDQAAVREYDPNDTTVYIEDECTALVGSVDDATLTDAERQRSAELRALAVEAFNLTNEQRVANGLPELVWRDDLAAVAQVRAIETVTLFSHTRPNGTEWWTVNGNIMYGENLARKFSTAAGCVNGWMNSPDHRANILSAGEYGFTSCGIAVYEDANGTLYWTQIFGY